MNPGDLIIFALPLLLLFWIVSRSRKQQRDVAAQQSAAQPGRRVMMTSGLYGEIVSVGDSEYGDNTVVVEIAPGVRTTWARQAIGRVLPDDSDDYDGSDHSDDEVGDGAADDAITDDAITDESQPENVQDTRPEHR